MLHDQFLSNLTATNNQHHHHSHSHSHHHQHQRPLQQSSPSDNSVSTATPPHQISRASPASTALVMSTNNIAGSNQPSNAGSNGNSTGSSLGQQSTSSAGSASGGGVPPGVGNIPPNPTMRFACHSKSMSAGVVVPVPGISNNLASAAGMQQNNMINNTIASQQQQQQMHHHQQQQFHHHHQQQQQQQQRHMNNNNTMHHHQNSGGQMSQKQQVIRERQSHHFRSISSQHQHLAAQQQQQHHHQQQQQQHQLDQIPSYQQHIGSSQTFIDGGSSSIILSNTNINNIHNRSASTHLSNIIMGSNHHHHHHHSNSHHIPQAAQRTHINGDQLTNQQAANSIWSIDEKLSKSHGKLTASSGYLHPQGYLFDPSITDISCDNVSTASRLLGGPGGPTGPEAAPGYYPHHHGANPNGANVAISQAASVPTNRQTLAPPGHHQSQAHSLATACSAISMKQAEFLPICDLMFNLISMIIYFCENVFGIIALIALYYHASSKYWALVGGAFVFAANFLCQYLSLLWLYKMKLEECRRKREAQEELEVEEECERRYYSRMSAHMRNYQCGSCTWLPDGATEVQLKFLLSIALDAIMHIFCLGFLVRYIKLVIPVSDTSRVKKEARDLCMLRMVHAFIQSAPLLLLQSYMVCSQNYAASIVNLSIISVSLSLVNICWALASFTKYARKKYMHKFVLTWLGILSQLLWRLGTISSRVAALTIYAVYYNYWMLVVLALHWITMFLWLMKPGNLLRDEINLSKSKKLSLAIGASWIYCFCYMNFEEQNSKTKMGIFYLIMFVENNLLFTVCQAYSAQVTWFKSLVILVVYLGFVFGVLFMLLYYKYFHVTVLNNGLSRSQDSIDSIADQLSPAGKKIAGFKPGTLRLKNESSNSVTIGGRTKYMGGNSMSATLKTGSHPEIARQVANSKPPYLTSSHQLHLSQQSGVFNCKLNTGSKRQKIPSSHVHRHNNG